MVGKRLEGRGVNDGRLAPRLCLTYAQRPSEPEPRFCSKEVGEDWRHLDGTRDPADSHRWEETPEVRDAHLTRLVEAWALERIRERERVLAAGLAEALEGWASADAAADQEFRISSDPPCEDEIAIARLSELLTDSAPTVEESATT